ncbi:hypothetical protein BU24DRAFT_124056 [Aaosphaeria arxii CBS 175.79]|uniref:Uncharacterized protein n=1 Tax=Aaosphaeria arxii CBS 175.79 TaxID=1450172 RepID=A0A6A5Y283_9PLEO|nr:uncharacterized protein BU24DRAFT_124056 [Aaosphaeria arxii CBS 175.79]KAF2019632.1 hypothetical protein BU24DRAFT_124056 [Aaosphaeria arxii CBS 175.79]
MLRPSPRRRLMEFVGPNKIGSGGSRHCAALALRNRHTRHRTSPTFAITTVLSVISYTPYANESSRQQNSSRRQQSTWGCRIRRCSSPQATTKKQVRRSRFILIIRNYRTIKQNALKPRIRAKSKPIPATFNSS